MNKGGLVAEVAKRTGLSKADSGRAVDAAIDTIRDTVVKGERVTLADFGTFERRRRIGDLVCCCDHVRQSA